MNSYTNNLYRDNWEDGNPATWRTSPQYHVCVFVLFRCKSFQVIITTHLMLSQPGTPVRTYDAPTPGSGWANTPGGSYGDSATPRESSYGNRVH